MSGANSPGYAAPQSDREDPGPLIRAWRENAVKTRDAAPLGPVLLPGSRTRWATVQSEWEAFALLPHGRRRELLEFVASELVRNAARVSSGVVCAVTQHDDWLVIDVIDHAGATTGARLEAALSRARTERRAKDADLDQIDCGAGVGLFLIERRAAWLTIRVTPGRFTRATAALWLGLPSECVAGIGADVTFVVES